MHDDGYFDERVAASYDQPDGDEFDPALIETIVDFLVECAGAGRALELGMREPFTSASHKHVSVWEKPPIPDRA